MSSQSTQYDTTTPDTTTLLESFRHDFNHIGDGRILVEPEKLAAYIAEQRREAVLAELKKLETLPNVYPEKLNCEYTHAQAIYKSAVTDRVKAIEQSIKQSGGRA